jgi:spermidine/putrescine transport system permease protein
MIGNAIQAEYLELENYPLAAATAFILMAAILAGVIAYFRFAGAATLMGEEGGELTEGGADERRRPPVHGRLAWLRRHALDLYAGAAIAYMLIPIAVIAAFSFNDPAGTFNFTWQGFTTKYWADPFGQEQLTDAFLTSLSLAAVTTVLATAIGTMLALALVRHRFRGRRAANLLIILPLATPEVVIGAALLSMFIYLDVQRGFETLLLAHVMFCLSFVVIVVRSRLIGFDRSLEEAAADLGAGPLAVFRRITLPLIAPAVAAAGFLAFALSIDDFVISNFNAGQTVTFPLYIYGASQRGMPVEINVLATMLFAVTVAIMALGVWRRQRAQTRLRRTSARAPLAPSPSDR